jgi:uncharacterized protein (DUF1501 family)
MKKPVSLSRRSLLQGAGISLAAGLLGTRTRVASAADPQKPAVVLIFLYGGHNALFGSADSFVGAGTFGVTSSNILDVGSGIFVDRGTFGTMPAAALAKMASIGVKHGLSAHDVARPTMFDLANKAPHVVLAKELGGDAAIKCASIGRLMPGPNLAIGDVSVQPINDLGPTLEAMGASTVPDTRRPEREVALAGVRAASAMSGRVLTKSPASLVSVREGYDGASLVLAKAPQSFAFAEIAAAYGQARTTISSDFASQMLGAEIMLRAGANVVTVGGPGLDSHGDVDGVSERARMARIMPGLNVFLSRTLAMTDRNVVTVIFSEFSRSLPGSDHAANLTATVIGNRVKQGTTGRVDASVRLPAGTASIPGFWAYVGQAAGLATEPFGKNPHPLIA